jgi:hypothetical protein
MRKFLTQQPRASALESPYHLMDGYFRTVLHQQMDMVRRYFQSLDKPSVICRNAIKYFSSPSFNLSNQNALATLRQPYK